MWLYQKPSLLLLHERYEEVTVTVCRTWGCDNSADEGWVV